MSCEIVPFVDGTDTLSAQPHHNTNLKAVVEDLHAVSIEKCKRGKRLEPLRRRIKIRRVKRTKPRNTGKGKAVVGAMDDDVRPFDLLGLRSAERIDRWKRFWVEADLIGRNHDMRHYLPPKKGPKCVTKMNPNSEFVKHLLEKIKEPSVLHLRGCDQLFSPYASPFSFDKFKTLICLEICGVSNLTTFPENTISEMTQLQFLLLSHLPIPQLPTNFFSNLVHLRSLTLKDCPSIHSLPEFPKMIALEYLELSHLLIETLPYGCFSCLKELEKLILRGCSKLSSLPSFDPLRKLRELDLSHCTALQEIELKYLSRNVKKLDLSYTALHNWCVTSSPTSMVIAFTHLFLRDAKVINFKEFPNCRLFHLKVLDVSGARYVKHLDLLKESEALEALDLSRTRIELESIDFISFMEKLRYLILRDCTWLQKLPAMEKLTHLEVLDISGCENLGDLP